MTVELFYLQLYLLSVIIFLEATYMLINNFVTSKASLDKVMGIIRNPYCEGIISLIIENRDKSIPVYYKDMVS